MENFNLAFYTYFYGSDRNSSFAIPELPSIKYKCYYFTNNSKIIENLKKTNWITIYDNKKLITEDLIQSCMDGKHIKTMPQEYSELKEYDYLCYLDSKLDKINENFVKKMITKYFIEQNYALLLRNHCSKRNTIWDEFNESMLQPRYVLESNKYTKYIKNQLDNNLTEIVDQFCMCGFLIRNMKHSKMIEINNTWYKHIQECGIQDQISFFFIKQLFNEYIHPFAENPFL